MPIIRGCAKVHVHHMAIAVAVQAYMETPDFGVCVEHFRSGKSRIIFFNPLREDYQNAFINDDQPAGKWFEVEEIEKQQLVWHQIQDVLETRVPSDYALRQQFCCQIVVPIVFPPEFQDIHLEQENGAIFYSPIIGRGEYMGSMEGIHKDVFYEAVVSLASSNTSTKLFPNSVSSSHIKWAILGEKDIIRLWNPETFFSTLNSWSKMDGIVIQRTGVGPKTSIVILTDSNRLAVGKSTANIKLGQLISFWPVEIGFNFSHTLAVNSHPTYSSVPLLKKVRNKEQFDVSFTIDEEMFAKKVYQIDHIGPINDPNNLLDDPNLIGMEIEIRVQFEIFLTNSLVLCSLVELLTSAENIEQKPTTSSDTIKVCTSKSEDLLPAFQPSPSSDDGSFPFPPMPMPTALITVDAIRPTPPPGFERIQIAAKLPQSSEQDDAGVGPSINIQAEEGGSVERNIDQEQGADEPESRKVVDAHATLEAMTEVEDSLGSKLDSNQSLLSIPDATEVSNDDGQGVQPGNIPAAQPAVIVEQNSLKYNRAHMLSIRKENLPVRNGNGLVSRLMGLRIYQDGAGPPSFVQPQIRNEFGHGLVVGRRQLSNGTKFSYQIWPLSSFDEVSTEINLLTDRRLQLGQWIKFRNSDSDLDFGEISRPECWDIDSPYLPTLPCLDRVLIECQIVVSATSKAHQLVQTSNPSPSDTSPAAPLQILDEDGLFAECVEDERRFVVLEYLPVGRWQLHFVRPKFYQLGTF